MKTTIIFFASLILNLTFANSYYPTDFKDRMHSLYDANLKSTLNKIISKAHIKQTNGDDIIVESCNGNPKCYQHRSLGYDKAREVLFGRIHLERNAQGYFLEEVYCNRVVTNRDLPRTEPLGPYLIPGGTVINCEHTWPQSKFNKSIKDIQKSDIHHLYPTENTPNSIRGNNIFAEVDGGPIDFPNCEESKIGYPKVGNKVIAFEPPPAQRGNIARALFYFSVRYSLPITSTEEYYLKKWNKEDPVDQAEEERNNIIHEEQGNRNPFIDYPELADQIRDF